MASILEWFKHLENSKIFSLLLFFAIFVAILVYVYANKKRSARLESYKYMPFQDEDQDSGNETDHKVRKP